MLTSRGQFFSDSVVIGWNEVSRGNAEKRANKMVKIELDHNWDKVSKPICIQHVRASIYTFQTRFGKPANQSQCCRVGEMGFSFFTSHLKQKRGRWHARVNAK